MMVNIITKTLDGAEFKLDTNYDYSHLVKNKNKPEQIIIPFVSFGIGSKLNFDKPRELRTEIELGGLITDEDAATVVAFYDDGKDNLIIELEKSTKKEEKMKFVNKIVRKLNISDNLNNKIFIDLLSNVFTDKQLESFIHKDSIEIILFDGLMYLKVGNKAYRL